MKTLVVQVGNKEISPEKLLWVYWWIVCQVTSVVSDSVRPHGLQPTRLLHPWDFPGNSTGVRCHCLLHDQPRQHIKKQRHYFAEKGPSSQSFVFSRSHICMWELDHKESWEARNWCFWTVVLEKTLESLLNSSNSFCQVHLLSRWTEEGLVLPTLSAFLRFL